MLIDRKYIKSTEEDEVAVKLWLIFGKSFIQLLRGALDILRFVVDFLSFSFLT